MERRVLRGSHCIAASPSSAVPSFSPRLGAAAADPRACQRRRSCVARALLPVLRVSRRLSPALPRAPGPAASEGLCYSRPRHLGAEGGILVGPRWQPTFVAAGAPGAQGQQPVEAMIGSSSSSSSSSGLEAGSAGGSSTAAAADAAAGAVLPAGAASVPGVAANGATAAANEEAMPPSQSAADGPYRRVISDPGRGGTVRELRVAEIRRPLMRTRANDQQKVAALMASIAEIGLQVPIDVLEVEGRFYGFSGCHRFEAHVRLGRETILCRVRRATPEVLKMHMR